MQITCLQGPAKQPRTPQPSSSPKRSKAAGSGSGAFEAFIASDASAFVEHTNQCGRSLLSNLLLYYDASYLPAIATSCV